MRINNNIMAMNTHRVYSINTNSVAKSTEKLSSGYRINRAGDDAAGLAISEKMRAQIRGLTMASKNSQDAISLVQTAEGALQETHNILQRMRELAVQSASDTNETTIDRDALNKEYQALVAEINDTADKTKFNDMGLIDGSYSSNITNSAHTNAAWTSTWAGGTVAAGSYQVTASTITVKQAVAGVAVTGGVAAAVSGVTPTFTITATSASAGPVSLSYAFVASTGDVAKDSSLNGTWDISFNTDKDLFVLKNQTTGKEYTAAAGSLSGAASTMALDFGIGILTVTQAGTGVINADNFTGAQGQIALKNGVTAQDAENKYVVGLNGEQIYIEKGQQVLAFRNSDLSVNLAVPFNGTAAQIASIAGTITVTKTANNPFVVQTGSNQGDELAISIDRMDASTLGVANSNVANRLDASAAITQVNTAVNLVSTQRAALGALQNRLQHKINNLDVSAENLSAAESRIRDLDMAKEMTAFTKNNILVQASTAMLAQANAAPQGVLQLLQ